MKHTLPLSIVLLASLALSTACGGGGAAVDAVGGADAPPVDADPGTPASGGAGAIVSTPGESFSPASISIAPGQTVTWQITGSTHNVTFSGATPTGGNIPDTRPGISVSRSFPSAGNFDYQCTRHSGMTGRVVVGTGAPPSPDQPVPAGSIVTVTASALEPERLEISIGGVVTWKFNTSDGIIFEDDAPPGGNIPETPAGGSVSRTFSAEGDYDYHSLQNSDVRGRIRVR